MHFGRIKSPAEMVVGTLRLAGGLELPSMETYAAAGVCSQMGQALYAPPSVEGWQGGSEWINTGSYVHRINFASKVLGNPNKPGLRMLISDVQDYAEDGVLDAERLVDACFDVIGPMPVLDSTRQGLIDYATKWGDLTFDDDDATEYAEQKIVTMLQMAVTTQEYQLA